MSRGGGPHGRLSAMSSPIPAVFKALAADRTGVVTLQPQLDAGAVEPVGAWQDGDGVAEDDVVGADGAFGFGLAAEHGFVDGFFREGADGSFGGGGRAVAAVLLH